MYVDIGDVVLQVPNITRESDLFLEEFVKGLRVIKEPLDHLVGD